MMKRYIITGTPGCGKTSIISALEKQGHAIVHEAATDIIACEQKLGNERPWEQTSFIDKIIDLQKHRQILADNVSSSIQFYDRSPICTYALAKYLNVGSSEVLLKEIERIQSNKIYENKVFFIENLGFCTPTDARKISFEESLVFEKIHAEIYTKFGYKCIRIPSLPLLKRMNVIISLI
ncbi:MAG: AAA family ATPase [Alphaproteobacteria bacterium]|nr:AAA family ATPase [Alphaproteobacteria bacterium]